MRRALMEGGSRSPAFPEAGSAKRGPVEIRIQSDDPGAHVGFEPIGLVIPRG